MARLIASVIRDGHSVKIYEGDPILPGDFIVTRYTASGAIASSTAPVVHVPVPTVQAPPPVHAAPAPVRTPVPVPTPVPAPYTVVPPPAYVPAPLNPDRPMITDGPSNQSALARAAQLGDESEKYALGIAALGTGAAGLGGFTVVALSRIIGLLPKIAVDAIRAAGGAWSSLPGWVRTLLTTVGIAEGTNIVIDDATSSGGILPDLTGNGGPMATFPKSNSGAYFDPQHGLVVGHWVANGTPFVKFADGYQAAYSVRRQSWRYWKPKKPIVLFADGASSPQNAARAYRALKKQAKRLEPLVRQFESKRRSRSRTEETRHPDGSVTIVKA